jgi:hypothetical protein
MSAHQYPLSLPAGHPAPLVKKGAGLLTRRARPAPTASAGKEQTDALLRARGVNRDEAERVRAILAERVEAMNAETCPAARCDLHHEVVELRARLAETEGEQ